MTTVIVILNHPNPHWKGRYSRRFINPDLSGMELQESKIAIRESNQDIWHTIDKSNIATITIIFSKDNEN